MPDLGTAPTALIAGTQGGRAAGMLVWLVACGCSSPAAPDDADTPGDTSAQDDTAALCPTGGDGDFDVAQLRVGDLSMPASYASVVAVLGEGACEASGSASVCSWTSLGTSWTFPDCDQDGAPDPDANPYYGSPCYLGSQEVRFISPYPGTTHDGLGIGVRRACWRTSLGQPGAARPAMDEWETRYMQFLYVTYDAIGSADGVTMHWQALSE